MQTGKPIFLVNTFVLLIFDVNCKFAMTICTQYSKAIPPILCNTNFHSATTKMPLLHKGFVSHVFAKKISLKFSFAKHVFILHSKIRNKFLMIARQQQQRLSLLYEHFNFFSLSWNLAVLPLLLSFPLCKWSAQFQVYVTGKMNQNKTKFIKHFRRFWPVMNVRFKSIATRKNMTQWPSIMNIDR